MIVFCCLAAINRKSVHGRTLSRFFDFLDGAQNSHGTVIDEIGPLPHSGLGTFQRIALAQTDVGDLALVDLHQAKPVGGFFHAGNVGLAVQGAVVVRILALLAHQLGFCILDLVVQFHQTGLAPQQADGKAHQQRRRHQMHGIVHGCLQRRQTPLAALCHPQIGLPLCLRGFSAAYRVHIICCLTHDCTPPHTMLTDPSAFSIFPKLSGGRTGCAGSPPAPGCLLRSVCG